MIQRIAILGVGLIGGSLALAWKKVRDDLTLVGYDAPDVLDRAERQGVIDVKAAAPEAAVEDADLVVLATPLAPMLRLLSLIAPHLAPGTLVTDVGSVKTPIVEHARSVLPEGIPFIGGHPMAGAERGGVEHADALLFENATYVLCPSEPASDESLDDYPGFVDLIESTGARVLLLEARQHDRIAAAISHLPQILAVLLTNYAAGLNEDDDAVLQLAAGGFRDMTRIASSPFPMWRDVLIANQGPLLDTLGAFAAHLRKVRNRLIEEDVEALRKQFNDARHVRDAIPRDSKGFLHPLADIYVFAEDRPGELLSIIETLYEAELNIKDIELLKIREGTGGAFRMSFADDDRANTAVEALSQNGFIAYRL